MIDRMEVGRRVSPRLRVAFEVADAQDVTERLVRAGAELLAPPIRTPWRSLNSRLDAPGGPPAHRVRGARGRRSGRRVT